MPKMWRVIRHERDRDRKIITEYAVAAVDMDDAIAQVRVVECDEPRDTPFYSAHSSQSGVINCGTKSRKIPTRSQAHV